MATNKNQLHNQINVEVGVVAYVYCEHACQFHVSCQCQYRDTTNGVEFSPAFSPDQLPNYYNHFCCQQELRQQVTP